MSRIDDLIAVLAPRGIECKPMAGVFAMRAGSAISATEIAQVQDSDHPYPCFGGNGIRGFVAQYTHNGDFLLVGRQGALSGNVKRTRGRFYATEHAVVFTPDYEINVAWAFHMLTAMNLNQYVSKGAQPGLAVRTLAQVEIPVPPVEVQREIARVLDLFQTLETELKTELEARRRQFAFYRDDLLSFRDDRNIRRVPLGEIGEFIRGRRFVKDDAVDAGIPAIHYGEIYTDYGTSTTTTVSQVRQNLRPMLRFARTGDVVIAGVGETVEDVGKAVAWLGKGEVAIHDDCFAFRHSMNPKFVAYCLQTTAFNAEKNKYVARAKVKRLSADGLRKLSIPVPQLVEQERIVDALDKFDALVNDLRDGLPAEIKARRQQYTYYRDRLLTFEESTA